MYANTANYDYAGCGCTSLAPYAGPRFVTTPAYGVEPAQSEGPSLTQKVLVVFAGFAAIYGLHRLLGGFAAPPASRKGTGTTFSTTPRQYRLPR